MKLIKTSLDGVLVVEPSVFPDSRGHFFEVFHQKTFQELGLPFEFIQDNFSTSHAGVIRGLHFQRSPYEQGKLVQCFKGEVFDVAVDLRPDSATFGKWEGVTLSAKDHRALYIPPGFAHGFQALEESCVFYKCTTLYNRIAEEGIRFDDLDLAIRWPLETQIVSDKDLKLPPFSDWKREAHL